MQAFATAAIGRSVRPVHQGERTSVPLKIIVQERAAKAMTKRKVSKQRTAEATKLKSGNGAASMTTREREVFDLIILEGLNDTEIADRLGIAEPSAKSHTSNVLRKMGMPDPLKLAVTYWRSKGKKAQPHLGGSLHSRASADVPAALPTRSTELDLFHRPSGNPDTIDISAV